MGLHAVGKNLLLFLCIWVVVCTSFVIMVVGKVLFGFAWTGYESCWTASVMCVKRGERKTGTIVRSVCNAVRLLLLSPPPPCGDETSRVLPVGVGLSVGIWGFRRG